MAKISTKDFENLPIDKWNATTYRAFMADLHQRKYGIPYVANNMAVEGKFLKNMYTEYGQEVTKRFIAKCFETYKPTPRYPALNFGFMYSYMRQQNLPVVLKEMATEQLKAKRQEQEQQTEIDTNWF
jgi:hypothetical protein